MELGESMLGALSMNTQGPDDASMMTILAHGTEYQKEKFLKPLLNGDKRICFSMTEKAAGLLDDEARARLAGLSKMLHVQNDWTIEALEATTKAYAEQLELGLGKLAQPMRAALTGTTTSPGIFDVLVLLGKEESLLRIDAQAASPAGTEENE